MIRRCPRPALALALTCLLAACGSDSTGPGSSVPPADFSGNWQLTLEVVAKRTCSDPIGHQSTHTWPITQNGSTAAIIVDNVLPIDLAVKGNSATGHGTADNGGTIDLALTLADGAMSGTITIKFVDTTCTEVNSVTGTRVNEAPSSDFAGSWDLHVAVTSSSCESDPAGSQQDICRAIHVIANSVSIDDPDGTIVGVGDGNTALLQRITADEMFNASLTVSGSSLSGQITSYDQVNQCQVTYSVSGTKRDGACPPPPSPGDFAGSWFVNVTEFSESSPGGCPLEQARDFFAACMTVTVNGSNISVDDGSGRGLVTGTVDSEGATLTRTEANGAFTLHLQPSADQLAGSATMNYTSGNCASATVDITLECTRLASPCGSASGPFAGYWDIIPTYIENGCGFPPAEPGCSELFQSGNTVFFVDEGFAGTVSGNTLTVHDSHDEPELRVNLTTDVTVQLSGDHNSFTGTETVTIVHLSAALASCTTSATLSGTRTSSCTPASSKTGQKKLFGLGVKPKTTP